MTVSDAIKAIRKQKDLTYAQVAEALGIEQPNYFRLEKRGDKLTIEQLRSIADALGVTIRDILFYGQPDDSAIVKKLTKRVRILKRELDECKKRGDVSRREQERFSQAFHKLAYNRNEILSEIIEILKSLQAIARQQRFNDFEFYWFLFIKEINNDSAIMKAYIVCRTVGMEEDFLDNVLEDFYECITVIDGIMIKDSEEWKEILFGEGDIDRAIDLTEQTKRKLDVKSQL